MNTNNTTNTAQPSLIKSIAPTVETCLHFARLAEVAAIAGVHPEAVQHALGHICALLDDLVGTPEAEEHALEVAALYEYADNALNSSQNRAECHEEVRLLSVKVIEMQERIARSSGSIKQPEKHMFYIDFYRGAQIILAESWEEANALAEKRADALVTCVVDVRLATDEDKNWLVSMGGTLPVMAA